jgi:hypothetical protein
VTHSIYGSAATFCCLGRRRRHTFIPGSRPTEHSNLRVHIPIGEYLVVPAHQNRVGCDIGIHQAAIRCVRANSYQIIRRKDVHRHRNSALDTPQLSGLPHIGDRERLQYPGPTVPRTYDCPANSIGGGRGKKSIGPYPNILWPDLPRTSTAEESQGSVQTHWHCRPIRTGVAVAKGSPCGSQC